MARSCALLLLIVFVAASEAQTNKFSSRNFYQAFQPQVASRQQQQQSSHPWITGTNGGNIFNDRGQILYKPQTPIVLNDGQEKEGDCPVTRPTTGYSSFKQVCSMIDTHIPVFLHLTPPTQYEGIWFKRYRSRVRVGEPFFKCAWIDYMDQGNNNIFISDNLQNNQ